MKTLREKAESVLACAYKGFHNVPNRYNIKESNGEISISVWIADLSTYDGDALTRLVIWSHEECVRLSMKPSGPGMIKLVFHDRINRDGSFYERHPTIETAIAFIRKAWGK